MRSRPGFTLIELVATIMIMLVLTSLVLMAMSGAQQNARTASTKSTIAKLHMLLSRRWDSYKHRRVPVDTTGRTALDARAIRLAGIRKLMRFEMPERWPEVTSPAELLSLKQMDGTAFSPVAALDTRPALSAAYLKYEANHSPSSQFGNSECLYMILTVGNMSVDGGRNMFSDNEIGDLDNDGAMEFIDGWGTPIRFLRWPVGFIDDPRQDASSFEHFGRLSSLMPAKAPEGASSPYVECKGNAVDKHDPFDRSRLQVSAYLLYPLIYSSGPDRISDIYAGPGAVDEPDYVVDNPFLAVDADTSPCDDYDPLAPYTQGTASVGHPKLIGMPKDLKQFRAGITYNENGELNHYDNIHNHLIDAKQK